MTNDERTNMRVLVERVMNGFSGVKIDEDIYSSLRSQVDSFPFIVSHAGICKLECKKQKEDDLFWLCPVSSYIAITKKLVYIDGLRVDIMIEYFDGNTVKERRVDREMTLSKIGVKSLLKYGISFNESRCDSFLLYLLQSDNRAPIEYVHSHLGWMEIDGSKIFRSYKSLSRKGAWPSTSLYAGDLDIKPHGSAEAWLKMARNDVLPYTPLTFCMLCGFAAPVLSRLYDKYDLGSLIISISGDSSRGKTTAAMLAASEFSSPISRFGLVQSFNATQNYLITFLSEHSGLPIVFDEGGTYSNDFNALFYMISSGTDKGRLTKDAVMKVPLQWNSIVLTTAEFVPFKDDSPNGIHARCFCLTDAMTRSADHSDRIKTVISENYGKVGNQFVQWLLNTPDVDFEADYLCCKKILHKRLVDSGIKSGRFTSRVFSRLAVIVQVADYVSQCFDLNINMESLLHYIIRIERNVNAQTDSVQKALDDILGEVSSTSARYISETKLNPDNVLGKIEQDGDFKLISILRPEFNRICKKYSLQPKLMLKEFKQRQILDCEKDRLSRRVRLQRGLPEQVCYILKIKDPQDTKSVSMEF